MTEDVINALKRYEDLKDKEKEIEEELDMLKSIILPHMNKDVKVETERGCFTMSARAKWQYPVHIVDLDARLKDLKKTAEADGSAIETPGVPYIVYKSN